MSEALKGKVVLITGAARGIGAETARKAVAQGAKVALVGMEPDKLKALAAELGEGHFWFECDVTRQDTLERAVKGTVDALGKIDVVVANAGIANNGTVAVNSADAVARTLEVNLIGVARTVSTTLPHLISSKGYFLLVSSMAAWRPAAGMAAYCASKVGVEYFGDSLRMEVAHKGVAVGIAHPSWIDTDLVRDVKKDLSTFNEMLKQLPGPLGAYTSVEECADVFVAGIIKRQRRLFVPKGLARFWRLRWLAHSRWADKLLTRRAAEMVPRMEQEVQALGRSFGSQSVALGTPSDAARRNATG